MKHIKKFNENWINESNQCDEYFNKLRKALVDGGYSEPEYSFFKEDFIEICNSNIIDVDKASKIAALCEDEISDDGECYEFVYSTMLEILGTYNISENLHDLRKAIEANDDNYIKNWCYTSREMQSVCDNWNLDCQSIRELAYQLINAGICDASGVMACVEEVLDICDSMDMTPKEACMELGSFSGHRSEFFTDDTEHNIDDMDFSKIDLSVKKKKKNNASISIESGELAPNDGLIKVWWWKKGSELNQEWVANKPVWEIFDAHQTFLLCSAGETIEVPEELILNNFTKLD